MLDAIVEELRGVHGVHTVILYGSRARGDATLESDIDIAAFSDAASATTRDARRWRELFLDAFVYPTRVLSDEPTEELLKMRGGRALLDQRGLATGLFAALEALDARGPVPLAPDEAQMRVVWARKMLARIGRDDLEAHYRRHWLLFQLLEDYYALRARWYRGPKVALAELAHQTPAVHALFRAALAPHAAITDIERLVEAVVDLR